MRDLRLRVPFAAAALTVGALALPAAADAATTVTSTTPVGLPATLTIADDGSGPPTGDVVSISEAGGTYHVIGNDSLGNPTNTDTTVPVAADTIVTITGSANNDSIDTSGLADATYGALSIDGGAGDDTLLGGASTTVRDQVHGGAGNDRVDGGKGRDDQFGDAGNDTLIWNAGDASDTSDGGAGGADVVEINGATGPIGDNITVQPNAAIPNDVQVARTNLAPFTVDVTTTEKIVINGFAGDDTITGANGLATLVPNGLAIDAGPGNDTVTGGDGNDVINGGDDVDMLSGGAGDDMLSGGRGNDTMNGNDGNDVMSWSNGDASDVTNGGNGFDTTQVIEGGANDPMTVTPNGSRTTFARTVVGPFTMDMDTEALQIESLGGDDTLQVMPGVTQSIVADGGSGNDTFTGGDENDAFFGGLGDDTLTGGAGADLLDGQDGNDSLWARDGWGDLVRGGAGEDSAQVDTVDAVDAVEHVDAPAPQPGQTTTVTVIGTPPAPVPVVVKALAATVTTGSVKLVLSHGHWLAKLPVSCPAAEAGGCKATVTLWTAKAVKLGGVSTSVALGSKKVSLKPGQKGTVTITLVSGVAKLAHKSKLAARAVVSTTDANGNGASASRSVSLVLPAAKKK